MVRARIGLEQRFDSIHLVLRHQLRANLVHTELASHSFGNFLAVARQHDRSLHAGSMQVVDGLLGIVFHHVCNDDVAEILAVDRNVQDGADELAIVVELAVFRHELIAADEHLMRVDSRRHALARNLLDVLDLVAIDHAGIAVHHRKRDGMVGIRLGVSGV